MRHGRFTLTVDRSWVTIWGKDATHPSIVEAVRAGQFLVGSPDTSVLIQSEGDEEVLRVQVETSEGCGELNTLIHTVAFKEGLGQSNIDTIG